MKRGGGRERFPAPATPRAAPLAALRLSVRWRAAACVSRAAGEVNPLPERDIPQVGDFLLR